MNNILSLIDLTILSDNCTEDDIRTLCHKAHSAKVAAVCIFSHFIPLAKVLLSADIKVATVVNFPHGHSDVELVLLETALAIARGADEIDLVLPYHELVRGDNQVCIDMISQVKKLCLNKTLKVIIESGKLSDNLIAQASKISIDNGADFIKTSTGKVQVNATLEASEIMLKEILASTKKCGFKASGGIKTVIEAEQYIALATKIMGEAWVKPNNFRFGASSLLDNILDVYSNDSKSSY